MYILRRGSNEKLVGVLKAWLTDIGGPAPELAAGNVFDQRTFEAVVAFQRRVGLTSDGMVGPTTWGAVGREVGKRYWAMRALHELPSWLRNLVTRKGEVVGAMALDPTTFLSMYMQEYMGASGTQADGLIGLLRAIELDPDVRDIRWAAYMLATVKHECADTWQPIEEYGKGAGRPYGNPVTVMDSKGVSYTNAYYGRGYVQLTHKANYEKLGNLLTARGLMPRELLLTNPQKALDPKIAYAIMSIGMREGLFTGEALEDHIHGATCDYKHARKIINGLDQWERISGHARRFETILMASVR